MLHKIASIAQILSLVGIFPACYCAYGTWVTLHPDQAKVDPVNPTTLYICFGAFIAFAVIGGVAALISSGSKGQEVISHKPSNLPDSPLTIPTQRTFASLSFCQRLLVRHIYEHPGTAVTFLLPALSEMGFPPRVSSDALNKVLTTNLVVRDSNGRIDPNPAVTDIVSALIDAQAFPNPTTVWEITTETTEAVKMDAELGCKDAINKLNEKTEQKHTTQMDDIKARHREEVDKAITASLCRVLVDEADQLLTKLKGINSEAHALGQEDQRAMLALQKPLGEVPWPWHSRALVEFQYAYSTHRLRAMRFQNNSTGVTSFAIPSEVKDCEQTLAMLGEHKAVLLKLAGENL